MRGARACACVHAFGLACGRIAFVVALHVSLVRTAAAASRAPCVTLPPLPSAARRLIPITQEQWRDVHEELLPGTVVRGCARAPC